MPPQPHQHNQAIDGAFSAGGSLALNPVLPLAKCELDWVARDAVWSPVARWTESAADFGIQVLILARLAFRALALAGRRPWFAFFNLR